MNELAVDSARSTSSSFVDFDAIAAVAAASFRICCSSCVQSASVFVAGEPLCGDCFRDSSRRPDAHRHAR